MAQGHYRKEFSPKNSSAIIDTLNCHIVGTKIGAQGAEEWRAGYVADVARFVGAAGEDYG
jgi:hypothetical protein